MMSPSNTGEFTPVFTSLVQEVGLVVAATYGAVWRQCQRKDGVCRASLVTISTEINVDRATVMRSIKKLCELGYLIDQTPGLRNVPHTYILDKSVAECNSSNTQTTGTGKAQADTQYPGTAGTGSVEDKSVVIRNSSSDSTVAYNNSSLRSVAQSNTEAPASGQTVAESHLKRDSSLNPSINPSIESKRGVAPPENQPSSGLAPHTQALMTICKLDWEFVKNDKTTLRTFNHIRDFLIKKGATSGDIAEFDVWRQAHHWTGNSPPTLKQVGEYWPQYQDWVNQGRPAPVVKPINGHAPANRSSPPGPAKLKTQIDEQKLKQLQEDAI